MQLKDIAEDWIKAFIGPKKAMEKKHIDDAAICIAHCLHKMGPHTTRPRYHTLQTKEIDRQLLRCTMATTPQPFNMEIPTIEDVLTFTYDLQEDDQSRYS